MDNGILQNFGNSNLSLKHPLFSLKSLILIFDTSFFVTYTLYALRLSTHSFGRREFFLRSLRKLELNVDFTMLESENTNLYKKKKKRFWCVEYTLRMATLEINLFWSTLNTPQKTISWPQKTFPEKINHALFSPGTCKLFLPISSIDNFFLDWLIWTGLKNLLVVDQSIEFELIFMTLSSDSKKQARTNLARNSRYSTIDIRLITSEKLKNLFSKCWLRAASYFQI